MTEPMLPRMREWEDNAKLPGLAAVLDPTTGVA